MPRRAALLDDDAGAAGALDRLAGGGRELVRVDRQRLGDLALGEDLHGNVAARAEALLLEGVQRHVRALVEAGLEVLQVDRLRVRAEGLEGHRLLHVRTAQLAHPHVDRHLAALEPGAVLGARARAVALLAAAGGLAQARALAAADALARLARARRRLEGVQADRRLLVSHRSPRP